MILLNAGEARIQVIMIMGLHIVVLNLLLEHFKFYVSNFSFAFFCADILYNVCYI